MSLLAELLEAITSVMLGIEEGGRVGRIGRASEIEALMRDLEEAGHARGIRPASEEGSLILGSAVLVSTVEPLVSPDGRGLAEDAVNQLASHGVSLDRIEQPHPHVLAVAGSTAEGHLEVASCPRGAGCS
jgi:hypothetical protein